MIAREPVGSYERLEFSHKPGFLYRRIRCSSAALPLVLVLFLAMLSPQQLPAEPPANDAQPNARWQLPSDPTEADIWNLRIFDEPLVPIGGKPTPEENRALGRALSSYAVRTNSDDFSSLTAFLDSFPDSKWDGSLLLHLGVEYYNLGYYSKAMDTWERSWRAVQNVDDPRGKPQADRVAGELARMYSKLGRMNELNGLLASIANRSLSGPATQLIHSSQEALALMQNRPGTCFRCGPMALDSILSDEDPAKASNPLIVQSQSTTNGFSLLEVAQLSKELGMNYQMAFRSSGAPWVYPAVIHWKVGHYAALLRREGNRFLVKDHTFQSSLWMTASALEDQASGYFLIPPGSLPAGWRSVADKESEGVWGRGQTSGRDPSGTGPGDGPNSGGNCGSGNGMTQYTIHTMLVSLSLYDTPVGYNPPVGPAAKFTAYYSQNEANQPATFYYSNLGPDWDCNWLAYITDNPNSPGSGVTSYGPGGGTHSFTGYNSTTGTFAPEMMTQGTLVRTSASSYELQLPDGSKMEYTQSDGSTGSTRRIFLTQMIDPASNAVHLVYDSSLRITNIVDAIGQATTLAYSDASFPFAITQVTDPFGRSASFQYNSQGLLTQITDVLGITSQYVYGTNDFITQLITPYGTNVFASGSTNGTSWLQATDPLGESELAISPLNGFTSVGSDPSSTVPTNLLVAPINNYLNYRDTYFWGKQAFAAGAGNIALATVYHFLHTTDINIESAVLESIKKPLENRVWFDYPGMASGIQLGTLSINSPTAISRVLDDGSSQTSYYLRNSIGQITNYTDPIGRSFTYIYSTNDVDLLQSVMTRGGKQEIQATLTYNSQHRPLTVTLTSGQTTTNTYNSRGQILSSTDPLGEITSFAYNGNGYLLAITNPLQSASGVVNLTYDGFGRVKTATDTEGYTLAYTYDAMDRLTNISYPDGSSQQFIYSNLDMVAAIDRLGRATINTYNADRQLVAQEDPLGRITQYQYCNCGALDAIFDPLGNETSWDRDIQSRITAKHYADGSTTSYGYENTTSRLHTKIDEKGQQAFYSYYEDNDIAGVSYSNAAVATPAVTFTYDTNYNRITQTQDGVGTTLYTYNPINATPGLGAGMLASVSGPLPGSAASYLYDQLGRVTNQTVDGAAEIKSFDVLGRTTSLTNALGTFTYTYAGSTRRIASEIYPNGQTNLYTYYNNIGDERLEQISATRPASSLSMGYGYDPVGEITRWTNAQAAGVIPVTTTLSQNFSYDPAGQLTNDSTITTLSSPETVSDGLLQYAYDLAGNRLMNSTSVLNASPSTNSWQYSYNALNQLTGLSPARTNPATYRWDAENRLVAIIQGTNTSEFAYDGLGRRIEIVELTNGVAQSTNYYLWCGKRICEVRDASGTNILRRLLGQGESLPGAGGNTNYYYTRDHLGSVLEVADSTDTLVSSYSYDPFGQRSVSQEGFQATFGFAGDFVHQKSGLYLTWYRALDSASGRWISRDPLGEMSSENLYVYANNTPLILVDPTGLTVIYIGIQGAGGWAFGPGGAGVSVSGGIAINPSALMSFDFLNGIGFYTSGGGGYQVGGDLSLSGSGELGVDWTANDIGDLNGVSGSIGAGGGVGEVGPSVSGSVGLDCHGNPTSFTLDIGLQVSPSPVDASVSGGVSVTQAVTLGQVITATVTATENFIENFFDDDSDE